MAYMSDERKLERIRVRAYYLWLACPELHQDLYWCWAEEEEAWLALGRSKAAIKSAQTRRIKALAKGS